jgi:hypothetical protein
MQFSSRRMFFSPPIPMKSAHLFCLIVCLLFAAFVHAQAKDDPAKLEQMKQLILKDVKKACAPQRKQSESEWQAMIMSSEANKLLMRNAILAVERNNQEAYWDAVSRMDCMEDY